MNKICISLVILVCCLMFMKTERAVAQGHEVEIEQKIMATIQPVLDKTQTLGYDNFKVLYVKKSEKELRAVYLATHEKYYESKMVGTRNHLLNIYCSPNSAQQWFCSNPKTVAYYNEQNLNEMKAWVDLIE